MTRLEGDMLRQIQVRSAVLHYKGEKEALAAAAAEVAKRYIEKAFLAGRKKGIQDSDDNMRQTAPNFEEWSKENGVIK